MRRLQKFIGVPFLFGLFALYGCSTPAPLSETMIFPPHETQVDTALSLRGDMAMSLVFNFYDGIAYRYAQKNYVPSILETDKNAEIKYENFNKIGLGMSDTFMSSGNWAVGFALGYAMLGFDFTARLTGPYYLTAQFAVLDNGQIIIQRPILHTHDGGLTLGAYYRFDNYSLYKKASSGFDLIFWPLNYHSFRIHSVGLRSSIQFNGTLFPLYGFVSGGYSPEYKKVLFYLGFTVPLQKVK